jgi:hypothetical protein
MAAANVAVLHKPVENNDDDLLSQVISPFDISPSTFSSNLERRKTNRQTILNWIKDNLVEGVDFGVIPTKKSTPKKSLFKSGAERILVLLGVTQSYPAFKDYEQAAITGQPLEQIIIRCDLLLNGDIVASGIGARAVKDDFGNLNKSLKMATKSAMILACLSLVGLSEIFTLDLLEDDKPPELITSDDVKHLETLLSEHSIDNTRFINWLSKFSQSRNFPALTTLSQLPAPLLANVIEKIPTLATAK